MRVQWRGGCVRNVARLDDQAPARPYHTSRRQRRVLVDGEVLNGSVEVTDTGNNETPLFFLLLRVSRARKAEKTMGWLP